jgi:murein DD-endopeptidase MepM/ murein hydrolase activator NlpD
MKVGRTKLLLSIFLNVCLVLSLLLVFSSSSRFSSILPWGERPSKKSSAPNADKPPQPQVLRIEDSFGPSMTMQDMLLKHGFTRQEAQQLVADVRTIYNFHRVMAGNRIVVERWASGAFKGLRYEISDEEYLEVSRPGESYVAERRRHQYETVVAECYGRIEGSLWNTLVAQGEDPRLIGELIAILQWDVPFTTIQPGDSFKFIVEKQYRGKQFVKYGRIRAVQFSHGGRTFYAFLFVDPVTGKARYYDQEGRSVRKAFLKVPFQFSPRVTSRFSRSRFHPILHRRTPHLGVDFGAPTGTPVLASASGTVVFAGRDGGYGKTVRIRHGGGMTTSYGHLSKILVRPGQHVEQMGIIGRVGSTGLSTGPHLDYRVQDRGGRFLNPRNLVSLPSEGPIDPKYRNEFDKVRQVFQQRLAAIPEEQPYLSRVASAG